MSSSKRVLPAVAGTMQTDPRSGGLKRSSGVNVRPSVSGKRPRIVRRRLSAAKVIHLMCAVRDSLTPGNSLSLNISVLYIFNGIYLYGKSLYLL
jgi:hypothetical protein